MKRHLLFIPFLMMCANVLFSQPIQLHPDNPHYFNYKGEPMLLITSAEHYGAVINLDFDYITYLNTLQEEGMNYTRIFTGSYVEIPGSFGIEKNTLAPPVGRYIAPWKRVNEPGLYEGEGKFDLSQWDPDYFSRLKNFISEAEKRDIIVEVTFFSSTYQDTYWKRNPFNHENNINNLKQVGRTKSNTLENGNLTTEQKAMVIKIVTELNAYDNVIYEIQNEPWADNPEKATRVLKTMDPEGLGWAKWAETATEASLAWQHTMIQAIVETEASLPKKHLIAQNYTNFFHPLNSVHADVSILNFHYAWPKAVWMNYGWNKPIGYDESGFDGQSDTTYLRQAWQFILAGGAVFNNLDYSFFAGAENGTGKNNAPGGGSPALRKQLGYLHDFMKEFEFVNMAPDFEIIQHSPGVEWQALSEKGKQYAIVFTGKAGKGFKMKLPPGSYRFKFVSPFTGETLMHGEIENEEGIWPMIFPQFDEMVALKIKSNAL
ncbi:MAG: cellulase family glycosylhydrolase [Bacteroidota bacterium]